MTQPDSTLPMELGTDLGAPDHGPGCKETIQMSRRFPGEHRYVCAANCPRKRYLEGWMSRIPVAQDTEAFLRKR